MMGKIDLGLKDRIALVTGAGSQTGFGKGQVFNVDGGKIIKF
jgi:hypothetical protein